MTKYLCTNCLRPYPEDGLPHRCLHCGGIFSMAELSIDLKKKDGSQSGLWAYQHSFGLTALDLPISLGEGATPLISSEVNGKDIHFKLEYQNPTGSYKDRASTLLLSEMKARGISAAMDDSSGNAGASFAAYAARAGIEASVILPENAAGVKVAQAKAYGAHIHKVNGKRSAASEAALSEAEQGAHYASHAYQPFGLVGIATIAYELVEQLGRAPGMVMAPAGHGSLLLGISMGFAALKDANEIEEVPKIIAVQASACAPLWAIASMGAAGFGIVTEGETLAEGVRVLSPLRGDELLRAIQSSHGDILIVDEDKIIPGRNALAGMGFYVEPTSAIVWDAIEQLGDNLAEPTVVILTGSGLKDNILSVDTE